jgi:hypothetical protein
MRYLLYSFRVWALALLLITTGCEKAEYAFGDIITPSGLTLTTAIEGVNTANPDGNGTGRVLVTAKAAGALSYKVDFGDGNTQLAPSGVINYKYATPGVNEYTITVSAIGTGGTVTNLSKKIKVFVAFEIPTAILQSLTGTGSRVWVCDKDADAHFGVGPSDAFVPIWYAASPNSRAADGFYDDEITFSRDATNQVSMNVDNKGMTFVLGAAVGYYGLAGPEGPYPIVTAGVKKLSFMDAVSASTSANSTRIQFTVPDKGIVCIGLGSKTYEILSITATQMHLRTIGADGNSWFQKFKVK